MQRNTAVLLTFFASMLFAVIASAQATATPAALKRCTATTQAGTPCKNYQYKTATTCYNHTPDIQHAPATTCGRPTQTGSPCKAKVKGEGTPCFNHAEDTPRCNKPTAKGTPCQRATKDGTPCPQHATTTK